MAEHLQIPGEFFMKKIILAAAAAIALNMSHGALAQSGANAVDDTQLLISQIQADRKAVVLQNMGMTDEETAAFVPIYDEYQAEQKKLAEERIAIVDKFAKHYNSAVDAATSMDDNAAAKILKSWSQLEDRDLALNKKYVKRFEKVLPASKVLRLVQIENKINALVDIQMAQMIPLAR
jgi:hypothetical protein